MKTTKLDELLSYINLNPGCTRKEIHENMNINSFTLKMYLSSYYGYKRCTTYRYGRPWKSQDFRPEYICIAEFKPAKGRTVHAFYLTDDGEKRVKSLK